MTKKNSVLPKNRYNNKSHYNEPRGHPDSVQCTVYSVQCTVYSVQCTLLKQPHLQVELGQAVLQDVKLSFFESQYDHEMDLPSPGQGAVYGNIYLWAQVQDTCAPLPSSHYGTCLCEIIILASMPPPRFTHIEHR